MSWALEEWKEGLPTRALQKIQELEGQLDKLKKEKQQRQFQLETLEAALQKQKQKVENEKSEGTNLKRENQRLMEICENLEKAKQKISHELQVKDSQVNFQEGQLNSSKKQVEKLEQELKRCKSELERSQQAAQSAEVSSNTCSTPQKIFATPLTPSQYYSGSKYEDLKEKYNKEVEERRRLEAEVKVLQAKNASQAVPQATMNHRDIARHHSSSSVFSWQQEWTPSRLASNAQNTPVRRDFMFGEQEVTPSRTTLQRGKRDANSSFCDNSSSSHLLDQLKAQNQELRGKINELEQRLQQQEKEIKGQVNKFQELHLQMEKTKVELMEKEKTLNKNRDELLRTTAQYDQAEAKCTALEQKLKKLTEDLSCQRQNAETAKCSLEQKIKEKEKEFHEELCRQQRSFQTLDQEYTQMKAKLTQELQQAKKTYNLLQAELEKGTSVKQELEKQLGELQQKVLRTEQVLQASQSQEGELRRRSEDLKKENGLLKSQSELQAREACHLEEELRKVKQCLNQSQNLVEEIKAKNASQETTIRNLQEKINQQENCLTLDKLKLTLADLEKQRDCSQDLLQKREHHIEQLNDKLAKIEEESQALLSALELKKKENEELKQEKTVFSSWKSEHEKLVSQMESERESLQSKLNHLESCLKTQQIKSHECNERVRTLEMERENLNVEIRNLHNVIDRKSMEIETQKQAYVELQQKAEFSDQKHKKEIENMCLKTSQLTGQVEALEHKLQLFSSEMKADGQCYQRMRDEYESLQDPSLATREDRRISLLALEQQPAVNKSFEKVLGEPGTVPSERDECHFEADQSPKNSSFLQNKVISLEFSLESQKQMNSDLQKHCEELVHIKGEIEENLSKAEQMHQSFVAETSQRISRLQEDTSAHQNAVAETLVALANKEKELQLLNDKLETEEAEMEELKKSNRLLEDSLKELQLLSESLTSEKKEMSSVISLNKKEIEVLTQENQTLKEINVTLSEEKIILFQKSENLSNCIEEREKTLSELAAQYQHERLTLLQRCEETGNAFEDLSVKYKAAQEKNSKLESLLNECTIVCDSRKHELEQLKDTFTKEHQEILTQLASAEEQNQKLTLELEMVEQQLRSEMTDLQNHSKNEADGLKQEIMSLRDRQSQMQKEVNDLLQENERLSKLKPLHEHQNLELVPVRDSMKERENEVGSCGFQLPMDLELKDIPRNSVDSYNTQMIQLEAIIRNTDFELQQSEKEQQSLKHELQIVRGPAETANVQDCQSREISDLQDCEVDAEGKYISVLHELSTSHSDNLHLQCSLRTAMDKPGNLEKMNDMLLEKHELNDSRSECVTATTKMAEETEKPVNEDNILNDVNGFLQDELVQKRPEGEFSDQQNEQNYTCLNPLDNSYESITSSSKEIPIHFAELQDMVSSPEREHRISHGQNCQMSSEMSELESHVDCSKTESSVLPVNLRNFQGDLTEEMKLGPKERSFFGHSPRLSDFGELSFCEEQTGQSFHLNNLDGSVSASLSNVNEVSCCSVQENLTMGEAPLAPVRTVEELETLCHLHLQSLKNLEGKIKSQGVMENKDIQELEQLLRAERKGLACLRKQCLSENEQWKQKLTTVTLEMEAKLVAERKQTEHLSLELEVARLELQRLDLSSRSLLGTDLEEALQGQNNSCDIKESDKNNPETIERIPKQNTLTCDQDRQQDPSLETEKFPGTGVVRRTQECPGEQSSGVSYETPGADNAQDSLGCVPESSLSVHDALVPMDFLENQVTIEILQLQIKEVSNENVRLLHTIEDQDKNAESLLNEIKDLNSKLNLQEIQLTTNIETCTQLEKVVEELKKEKSDLSEKLKSLSYNHELPQSAETSEDPSSDLEIGTDKSSHEVVGDKVTVGSNWKEKWLDTENELNMIKAEKVSIEQQALSVKMDLEVAEAEKLQLEKDNDSKQKVIVCLEEELTVVTSERNRLYGELETVLKEKKALDQTSEKMREKMQELEAHHAECLHPIQVEKAEVQDKTGCVPTLSSDESEWLKDKAHLQEQLQSSEKGLQALSLIKCELEHQIELLNKEKESLVRESESMQAKLSEVEQEKLTASKALEVALIEKGEFAVRLSSTQEEVHQLRRGIEKLRVRIEADESKHLHVTEKLKESERENDLLKDQVENLERELQMSEENQELVILDAENSKAEVENLKAQIEETSRSLKALELDLVLVRRDKDSLTEQVQVKQGEVSELGNLLSSFKSLLAEKEQAEIEIKEECKAKMEMLQTQLKELNEEVAGLCHDQETWEAQAQGLDSPREAVQQLKSYMGKLKVQIEAGEKKQLQVLEQLKERELHAGLLKGQVENLEKELELSAKNQELVLLEVKNSKAEAEALKARVEEMASELRDVESDLVCIRSEKESLTKALEKEQERVSELETLNSSFENALQAKEQEKIQLKEKSEIALEMLQTQFKELNEEVAGLCHDQETWEAQAQGLDSPREAVQQLKSYMGKLKVQIEAGEKKQLQVLEQLKERELHAGLLKGQVENLEKELELSAKNQELVLLEVKNSKAEAEALKARVEEMASELRDVESDLVCIRSEKESLTKALEKEQERVSELETLNSSFENALQAKEQEKIQLKEKSEIALEMLQTQFKELNEEVAGLCHDQETWEAQAQGLDSPREAVQQLKSYMGKLKVQIEAGEKKQLQVLEQLKERELHAGLLKGQVENLEKELELSAKNQELVLLEVKNSKAEAEALKARVEEMASELRDVESDLVCIRSEKESLTKALEKEQERVSELETLNSSFENALQAKEQEKIQLKEKSEIALEMLQTQFKELNEEVAGLCHDQETWEAQAQGLDSPREAVQQLKSYMGKLKVQIEAGEKKQLQVLEQLKERELHAGLLKGQVENLEKELELSAKNQELVLLEVKNSKAEAKALKSKVEEMASELRDVESDLVCIRSEKESLTKALEKEQERVSELETLNSSFENALQAKEQEKIQLKEKSEIALEMLQTQFKELNEKMVALCHDRDTWKAEGQNLSSQVDSLELEKARLLQDLDESKNNYVILQSSVNGLMQKVDDNEQTLGKKDQEIGKLKDQIQDQERLVSKLAQVEREQQLLMEQKREIETLTVELEQKNHMLQCKSDTLQDSLQAQQNSYKELEKELEMARMERTSFAETVNTMTLREADQQREIQELVQKMTELKEGFNAEKEKLTEELKILLEEAQSNKVNNQKCVNQLKKENEHAQGKIKLLLKSCKQLEEEKKMLQKELSQLEATWEKHKSGTIVNVNNVDELMTEMKELKETLEEKTKEADEYLDKYCSLLITHEKLEQAKEMLETRVACLTSQQPKPSLRRSPLLNAVVPGPSPVPSVDGKKLSGQKKASGKRQRSSGIWESGGGSTPSTPEMSSKKSRKVAKRIHPVEDTEHTEFEPEGLPEVVKKGFADIPTGKTSPYILRRTTMATRTSPRLAVQKPALFPGSEGKENLTESSKSTAGGSRSQKVKAAQQSPAGSITAFPDPAKKPASVHSLPRRSSPDSSKEGPRARRGQPSWSPEAGAETKNSDNCQVQ